MSAVVAPLIGKMLVGTVASKVVGKVTGNDKLAMIAGLAAGAMTPGMVGATSIDPMAPGALGAAGGAGDVSLVANSASPGQSLLGAGLDKGKDILTGTAGWVEDNPYGAIIGAQAVGGAASLYQGNKDRQADARENEKMRIHDMNKLREQEQQNIRTYDRTHQDFLPRSPSTSGGLLTEAQQQAGLPTAHSDYYNQYLNMYKGGVR